MLTSVKYSIWRAAAIGLALAWTASVHATVTTIAAGSSYEDPGFTALDNYDGDITARVVTTNAVNTSAIGTYAVTYNVTDSSGNAATPVVRTVRVCDTEQPVITLLGDETLSVSLNASFVDPGATALDNYDGDITSRIVSSGSVDTSAEGSYAVTYNVTDSSGNAATPVVRTVLVTQDTSKPEITLVGSSCVRAKVGRPYVDAGATARDSQDGNLTASIEMTSSVNIWHPGTYEVSYNVKDKSGNAADTVKRKVRVTFWSKTDEDVDTVFIASPLTGSTYRVPATTESATLTFTATAPLKTESVQFALDGTVIGSSTSLPYTVATEIHPSELGWGEHTITATAILSEGNEQLTDTSVFTLAAADEDDDSDANGIVDNPFTTLSHDGDAWSQTTLLSTTGGAQTTSIVRFEGVEETEYSETPVVLTLGGVAGTVITVTAPRNLLTVDETGILLVQAASDLESLMGTREASQLLPEPEGHVLVQNGMYIELAVLKTTDGGATFDEVEESRLEDHSVYLDIQGLAPSTESALSLYGHKTLIDSAETTGLFIAAQEASWSTAGVHDLTMDGDWVQARLTSLSLLAPYEPESETKTENTPGCAGSNQDTLSAVRCGGDILLLSVALLALLLRCGKAASTCVRATQRP